MPYPAHRPRGKKISRVASADGRCCSESPSDAGGPDAESVPNRPLRSKDGLWSLGIGMRRPIAQGLNGYFPRLQPSLQRQRLGLIVWSDGREAEKTSTARDGHRLRPASGEPQKTGPTCADPEPGCGSVEARCPQAARSPPSAAPSH